jgi:hypothetical protein
MSLHTGSPALLIARSQSSRPWLQDDALFGNLTVRETFWFAAELRLPSKTTTETKRQVVQSIIMAMGLTKAADTHIGKAADRLALIIIGLWCP